MPWFGRAAGAAWCAVWLVQMSLALEKEKSLLTKEPIGNLAVAGRLSIDLHAEFMVSRTYDQDRALNWYNCGYSGGGNGNQVGGNFGDFGLHVPSTERDARYPHAVTVDGVPALRFDGNDMMKGNFAVEANCAGMQDMAVELWLHVEAAAGRGVVLGWQSRDGREASAPIAIPNQLAGSNRWRHLVLNCMPDREDIYLDGRKLASGPRATVIGEGHIPVLGGACAKRPSFRGDLAAVRLHDEAMTEEEILHNFQGGAMLGTEMHNWWRTEPDKWWVQESAHFRHCVDKEVMRGWTPQQLKEFENRVPGMFNLAELLYHTYSERLAMRSSVVSRRPQMRGDGIKYKTPIQPSAGSWMGVDDDFGWACQGEGFINPHELAHGWHAQTGGAMQGNFWEACANFPQTYNGIYQTMPPSCVSRTCMYFPAHGRNFYHDRLMFEHLAQSREYGPMFISKLWYDGAVEGDPNPYPWVSFTRLDPDPHTPLPLEYTRMVQRNVTWDYATFVDAQGGKGNTGYGNDGVVSAENRYLADANANKADILRYARILLEPMPLDPGWWRVPKEMAPQQLGWNICPLKFKPGAVSAVLAGYANPERGSDWRVAFVGVDAKGKPRYGPIVDPGKAATLQVTEETRELYLVVCETPTRILPVDMVGDFRSFEQEPFPYRVKFQGCEPLDVLAPEQPAVAGAPHPNGGGFVESTAQVEASAYVGPHAQVLGHSKVLGKARVEDFAVVSDSTVQDQAVVSGHALVRESIVRDYAKVRDYARVVKTIIADRARILEHAEQNTKPCAGFVTVKGGAASFGPVSGTALIDGSYAKGNEITKGKWFTWSWGTGRNVGEVDEEFGGLYLRYSFEYDHPCLVWDDFGATWGLLAGGARVQRDPARAQSTNLVFREDFVRTVDLWDFGDWFGQELTGFVFPPESGEYTFWLNCDERAEVWLASGPDASTLRKICSVERAMPLDGIDIWTRDPSQKSVPVRLEKDKPYAIRIRHADGGGRDVLRLAWSRPGVERTIVGAGQPHLAPEPTGERKGLKRVAWRDPDVAGGRVERLLDPEVYRNGSKLTDGVLALNGKDAYVELPKDVADLRDMTLTMDVKWSGGENARIFEFSGRDGNSLYLSPSENGKLVFALCCGATRQTLEAPPLRQDQWTRVSVMLNGDTGRLFVDDAEVARNPRMTLNPDDLDATLCLLGRGASGGFFHGALDNVEIYTVSLLDETPPAPNPAALAMPPQFVSPKGLILSAVEGNDARGTVEYAFEEEGTGWTSGWIRTSTIRVDGRDTAHPIRYRVKMRDLCGNETACSDWMQPRWVERAQVFPVSSEGPTTIEAEHFAGNTPSSDGFKWERQQSPSGYTDEGAMAALPDRGSQNDPAKVTAARLDYLVNFTEPGRYFLWLRATGANHGGDSVHAGLDMKIEPWGNNLGTGSGRWTWIRHRPFHVDQPGVRLFSLWMREDGTVLDRLLFTADDKFEPDADQRAPDKALIGPGPAETVATPLP